jgi:hypothetical protein
VVLVILEWSKIDMNEIENCRKFYRILKYRDSSKFRVQRLVRTKLIYRLLGRDKYSWELLETGDRDVQYDFSSLNKAQESIDY